MATYGNANQANKLKKNADSKALNVRVFAHEVKIGGINESLFEENAYTLVYVDSSKVTALDALGTELEINTTITTTANRIDGSKMKMASKTQWTIYADKNVFKLFDKKTLIFTVGKPLNISDYEKGIQEVYLSRSTVPSEINQFILNQTNDKMLNALEKISEATNITTYELVNIDEINSISNSVAVFTNQKRLDSYDGMVVNHDIGWARSKITSKGVVDGIYTDIALEYQGYSSPAEIGYADDPFFGPMKMTPISMINKLTCISDTRDGNISLPYSIGSNFSAPKGLRSAIVNDTVSQWKKDLWQVLLSMLELTLAYSNGFSEYLIKGTDGRSGIDPDATIGGFKIGLLGGTNATDAVSSVSGRVEQWKQNNPGQVDSTEFKLFSIFVLMLSNFIQSDLCLGNGLNKGNRIFNIFYFDLRTAIVKGMADTWDKTDLEVQIKSLFFDIDPTTARLDIKPQLDWVSDYQAFDIDGYASLVELPEQLQTVNRIAKPGNINPTSEDIAKYYIYVPAKGKTNLASIYGKSNTTNTTGLVTISTSRSFEVIGPNWCSGQGPNPYTPPAIGSTYKNYSELEIYDMYIRGSLAVNERINYINNIPDVSQIKAIVTKNVKRNTLGLCGLDVTSNPIDGEEFITTVTISFTYVKEVNGATAISFDLLKQVPIFDKSSYLDFVKGVFTDDRVVFPLGLNKNALLVTQDITQIVMDGIWGNDFSLELQGKIIDPVSGARESAIMTIPKLEFLSKFDESQTKTKINI